MSDKAYTIKLDGLDKLQKMFKQGIPSVKVGILANKDPRKNEISGSNASIGLIHEFGTEKTPERSFLRMPLSEQLEKEMEKSGLFDEDTMKKAVKERGFKGLAKAIGIIAEKVIADAFATGGFGKWTPSNMKYKKNHQTLVETQQLRDSITSKVSDD